MAGPLQGERLHGWEDWGRLAARGDGSREQRAGERESGDGLCLIIPISRY